VRLAGSDGRGGGLGHAAVVDHVHDDHGDVVPAAGLVGEAHELGGGLGRVLEAAEHGTDLVLGDLA
jgi:hypothetical protein